MTDRITNKHVQAACDNYNKARKLSSGDCGFLKWADIRGDGTSRARLYAFTGRGGVCNSDMQRRTMRQTIAAIRLAIAMYRLPSYAVIIRAIHERGDTQRAALVELNARGLWLSAEQRAQAGLLP